MIRLDDVKEASAHIKARSAKMLATVLHSHNDFEKSIEVRVEPDEPENGKVAHTVCFTDMKEKGHFFWSEGEAWGQKVYVPGRSFVGITCYESESLRNCPANKFGMLCSHVESAIREVLSITGGANESESKPTSAS